MIRHSKNRRRRHQEMSVQQGGDLLLDVEVDVALEVQIECSEHIQINRFN